MNNFPGGTLSLPFGCGPLLLSCALAIGGCSSSSDDDSSAPMDDTPTTDAGTDGDMGTSTLIDIDSYEAILREAVDAVSITALDADADRVFTLGSDLDMVGRAMGESEPASFGLTFVSEEPFGDGVSQSESGVRQSYTCDAGGSLVLSVYEDPLRRGAEFDTCYVGTDLYDGGYDVVGGLREGSSSYAALTATYPDGSGFSIDGGFERQDGRTGASRTKTWSDTDYVSTDASGTEIRLSGLERTRASSVTQVDPGSSADALGDTAGYVVLADGSVALAVPHDDRESLDATLTLVSPSTGGQDIDVAAGLALEDSYYEWYADNPDGRDGFVVPDYPVSDLGSPLMLERLGTGETLTVEQSAQRGANAQWDSGSLTATAADGSRVVMSPSADDPSMVEIRVNGAGEPILRERSDGFAVSCPGQYDDCG